LYSIKNKKAQQKMNIGGFLMGLRSRQTRHHGGDQGFEIWNLDCKYSRLPGAKCKEGLS
jgi:hypothetical protein